MIAKVAARGGRLRGLIEYLYGRGRAEEHVNPHVVAAWDGDLDRGQDVAGRRLLVAEMEFSRRLFEVEVPAGPVYHVAISVHRDDGRLGDEAWRLVAERAADKLGFTGRPGRAGCRWVAVHHGVSQGGQDHIHLVADLVREDGTIAEVGSSDFYALAEMRAEMEGELDLRVRTGRSGYGERGVNRQAVEAARRRGRREPEAVTLARRVRSAVSAARSESDFVHRLRANGLLIRPHRGAGATSKQVVGYAVALPPTPTQRSGPIWYGGGRLARELSLPVVRQRWAPPSDLSQAFASYAWGTLTPRSPRAWEYLATDSSVADVIGVHAGLVGSDRSDQRLWASAGRETAALVAYLAEVFQPGQPAGHGGLPAASDTLAYAGKLPHGNPRGTVYPVLAPLQRVGRINPALLRGASGASGADLVLAVIALIHEIALYHQQTRQLAHARAAFTAAAHARDYYRYATGNQPPDTLPEQRERLHRQLVGEAMSRRTHSHYTDTALAGEIETARRGGEHARQTARRVRADLATLEPAVTGGGGPHVRELFATLEQLRRCTQLHTLADRHHQRAETARAESSRLGRLAYDLFTENSFSQAKMRWPGHRARRRTQRQQLSAQSDQHRAVADNEHAHAGELRGQAAQHGPRDATEAREQLRHLETSWPDHQARAHHHDRAQLAALRDQVDHEIAHAATYDTRLGELLEEQHQRASLPTPERAIEEHLRATQHRPHPPSPNQRTPAATRPRRAQAGRDTAPRHPTPPVSQPPPHQHRGISR